MNNTTPKACCSMKEWMVPPLLVPLALIVLLAMWVVLRPHVG